VSGLFYLSLAIEKRYGDGPLKDRLFTYDLVTDEDYLRFLKLHTLYDRRVGLDALFFISVYSGSECCPSLFDITGIRDLPCNFRNSCLFSATCRHSPVCQMRFGC
jgi:hypothetical protein